MSFEQLLLIEPILLALKSEGYLKPTPIQEKAIPVVLQRRDLLGCAQTGTGKTAAFALPIIQLLYNEKQLQQNQSKRVIRALVVTPTRELAIQIGESFATYGKHTSIRCQVIFGGVPQNPQTNTLKAGTDILVATPGRLLDLIDQKFVSLEHLSFFILDEADRMLDMGFIHDVRRIITKLPAKRQSLFFSATMPPEIQKLSSSILVNPVKVEVAPVESTSNLIRQALYYVEKTDKRSLLLHLLKDPSIASALVFTRTKHGADRVCKDLNKGGVKAAAIHGNKTQSARQNALSSFRNKTLRVLVATDLASRGIDVEQLSHVINFEIPNIPETYVHRIGRTGRAGVNGIALSFCDRDEKAYMKDIIKLTARKIPVIEDHPFRMS
ncbi:MAG: DEAD/DEAH box helicase [Bacteroidetes bacterium]|nr:DEAD/DEAH box helicase [Bacteroidota bacterium]